MFSAKPNRKSPMLGDDENESADLLMTMKRPWNPPGQKKGAQTVPEPRARYVVLSLCIIDIYHRKNFSQPAFSGNGDDIICLLLFCFVFFDRKSRALEALEELDPSPRSPRDTRRDAREEARSKREWQPPSLRKTSLAELESKQGKKRAKSPGQDPNF